MLKSYSLPLGKKIGCDYAYSAEWVPFLFCFFASDFSYFCLSFKFLTYRLMEKHFCTKIVPFTYESGQ